MVIEFSDKLKDELKWMTKHCRNFSKSSISEIIRELLLDITQKKCQMKIYFFIPVGFENEPVIMIFKN